MKKRFRNRATHRGLPGSRRRVRKPPKDYRVLSPEQVQYVSDTWNVLAADIETVRSRYYGKWTSDMDLNLHSVQTDAANIRDWVSAQVGSAWVTTFDEGVLWMRTSFTVRTRLSDAIVRATGRELGTLRKNADTLNADTILHEVEKRR